MSARNKDSILIVDDAAANLTLLTNLLGDDYELYVAKNGRKALEVATSRLPSLILMDIIMPEMDGYEACKRLKETPETANIPVIFITSLSEEGDEQYGFEQGAVDYIIKPFRPSIVRARVKTHLELQHALAKLQELYSMALDANPMTELPGNNSIRAAISNALAARERVCVIYADLDNFKAFNDKYGFAHGDEVILFTAQLLRRTVLDLGAPETFVGHIGGDDFVLMPPAHLAQETADALIERFDAGILAFYTDEDVRTRCICSVDRQGRTQEFPLISISMVGANLASGAYAQYMEVSDACAELKKVAKNKQGSAFVMDRRGRRTGDG